MTDLRQSPQWAKYMEALGWKVETTDNCQVYIKKLPLGLGSIIKILRSNPPIPFEEIDKIAKKHRAWFVKLEPGIRGHRSEIIGQRSPEHGFHASQWPLTPTKTIQVDLRKSVKRLWADLKKETRNVIRKASQNHVVITQSESIEQFCYLWVKSMRRKGNLFATGEQIKNMWQAFDENAHLLLAPQLTNTTQPVAGALIITYDQVASYIFAASAEQGNKIGAPSLIVWEAILLAKKLGCKIFDFEGIYDPRCHKATKSWQGFTRFKKGFGGKEVEYVGSFIKCYNRLLQPLASSF